MDRLAWALVSSISAARTLEAHLASTSWEEVLRRELSAWLRASCRLMDSSSSAR